MFEKANEMLSMQEQRYEKSKNSFFGVFLPFKMNCVGSVAKRPSLHTRRRGSYTQDGQDPVIVRRKSIQK